ncbi:MAG: hypothetical protein JWP25_7391 [Bradyrhizobium sp.]|jgi:hypothetical protein|nr:hypothetical protein [Bradyrhizobium sp.]
MPLFYFHHRSNGQLKEDQRGLQFPNADKALTHAMRRTSDVLGRILSSTENTYLTIEVTNGERSLCVVRGTVTIERR